MATRLEIATKKMERLKAEYQAAAADAVEIWSERSAGQPFHMGKASERSFKNRADRLDSKAQRLKAEYEAQVERVERLTEQTERKAQGLNRNGIGVRISIDNQDAIREAIKAYESGDVRSYTSATIRKYRKALEHFEELEKAGVPDQVQELVDQGKLTQWKKFPEVYFIKGFRKLAVVLAEGELHPSKRYAPKTEEEKAAVLELVAEKYRKSKTKATE